MHGLYQVLRRSGDFRACSLADVAAAFAKAKHASPPLFQAVARASLRRVHELDPAAAVKMVRCLPEKVSGIEASRV